MAHVTKPSLKRAVSTAPSAKKDIADKVDSSGDDDDSDSDEIKESENNKRTKTEKKGTDLSVKGDSADEEEDSDKDPADADNDDSGDSDDEVPTHESPFKGDVVTKVSRDLGVYLLAECRDEENLMQTGSWYFPPKFFTTAECACLGRLHYKQIHLAKDEESLTKDYDVLVKRLQQKDVFLYRRESLANNTIPQNSQFVFIVRNRIC